MRSSHTACAYCWSATTNAGVGTVMAKLTPGRLRKALHQPLQPQAARNVRPVQEQAARDVVLDILDDPAAFQSHISTYAATLVVHMAYGRTDRARYSDADIQEVIEGSKRLGTVLRPGAFKVEAFPMLKRECVA